MAARLTIKQLSTLHVGPLDLELSRGECVTLAGPSGAGKTLLLRALADLDAHDGELLLDGRPSTGMKAHEWRRHVGLLPAESQWWGESVGMHFESTDAALLHELGFKPEVMQWEVARCSTGERQRLALVRLLQNRPEVLLLDEPTASLDADNVERVEAIIGRQCREYGVAVIWVSHDIQQASRVGDRCMHMSEGKLEALD